MKKVNILSYVMAYSIYNCLCFTIDVIVLLLRILIKLIDKLVKDTIAYTEDIKSQKSNKKKTVTRISDRSIMSIKRKRWISCLIKSRIPFIKDLSYKIDFRCKL